MYRNAALLIIALVVVGCTGAQEDSAPERAEADHPAEPGRDMAEEAFDDAQGSSGLSGGGVAAPRADSDEQDRPSSPPAPPALPTGGTGERIIKEGRISVEVPEGEFDTAFSRVIDTARRVGGSVLSSSTRTQPGGGTAGSVTVRVPVDAFEDVLVGMGDVGEIRTRDVTAQDVTTEFIDLQSRLRHLEAQERFYLGLLEDARDVGDAIAVQQQLDRVQGQMEQIKGRLAYLDERTSYSSLTVELFEAGTEPVELAHDERPTLGAYWDTARDAFVNVIGGLLVAVFFVAPLLPLGLIAYAAWRRLRPAAAETSSAA